MNAGAFSATIHTSVGAGWLVVAAVMAVAIIVVLRLRGTVPPGKTGVVVRRRRILRELTAGPYFRRPWEEVLLVPTSIQTTGLAGSPGTVASTRVNTRDGLHVVLEGQIMYRISDPKRFVEMFVITRRLRNLPGRVSNLGHEEIIHGLFRSCVRPLINEMSMEEVFQNAFKSSQDAASFMNERLAAFGILIDELSISKTDYPREFQKTATEITEQKRFVSFLEGIQQLADKDKDSLVELALLHRHGRFSANV